MPVNVEAYRQIRKELDANSVGLVAVSKTKPIKEIRELYGLGHRDFGENYVQEMVEKANILPGDTRWHFIGHLQTNKVKLIAPFVQLIHGVDSLKLLKEINKQAEKAGRVIDCLLQVHIAREETKFGLDEAELDALIKKIPAAGLKNVRICGLMGMASFTEDIDAVRTEFRNLKVIFDKLRTYNSQPACRQARFTTLSMGMSSDYRVAVEEGSNLVRIGSLLFGERPKNDTTK
ncbi:MAG: YggS family pyridoxal phosphate-dependent enzyme [Bacteroidetes bacterium]|nr:YggS family pyridoxal phosphate-dependent enzyme [Bacteroidota bacterium]